MNFRKALSVYTNENKEKVVTWEQIEIAGNGISSIGNPVEEIVVNIGFCFHCTNIFDPDKIAIEIPAITIRSQTNFSTGLRLGLKM